MMPTPKSEDELNLGLAKLHAARMPQLRVTGLSYELTRTLVAMARQTSRLQELKDVLRVADVVVQTREEFEEALARAEAGGQAHAEMSMLGWCQGARAQSLQPWGKRHPGG